MAWNQGTPLAARLSAQQVRTPIDNARDWWRSLLRMRDLRYKLKRWAACVLLWIDEWDRTLWLGQLLFIRHGVDQAKISAFIERKREIQRAQERVLRFFGQLPDDVLHIVVSFCPHYDKVVSIIGDRAQAKQAIEIARSNEVEMEELEKWCKRRDPAWTTQEREANLNWLFEIFSS